jgi:four helix bundle protein
MTNDEGMTKSEAQKLGSADHSIGDEDPEWVVREQLAKDRVYDLEERTARFGEAIIDFAKTIPHNPVTNRLISQLVSAGTSVGANYVEADDSVSKKDFLKSIGTCRKEARETKHFLRMVGRAVPELELQARELWMEARELHLIFSKIWRGEGMSKTLCQQKCCDAWFVIRALSFLRPSAFVIRHSHHAC